MYACTCTTECSSEKSTAPSGTPSLVNHESEATKFDATVFLAGFPQTETAPPLSCPKPTDLQEYVDVVRAASQKPDKQTPPATLITLVGPHERAVIESIYCSDGPVDDIEKYCSLSVSICSESVSISKCRFSAQTLEYAYCCTKHMQYGASPGYSRYVLRSNETRCRPIRSEPQTCAPKSLAVPP